MSLAHKVMNRLIVDGKAALTRNFSNGLADQVGNPITAPEPNLPLVRPCEPNYLPFFTMH